MTKSSHFLAFLIFSILFFSCSNNEQQEETTINKYDQHKDIIVSHLKTNMNDPESFELAELTLRDSVLYKDNIEARKEMFGEGGYLEDQDKYAAIVEIEKNLGDTVNTVASYTYYIKFRGNNALGAKVLNEFLVQTDGPEVTKVLNYTNDRDKLYLTPNGFPYYEEMILKSRK
jgi:hypothetical protein